LNKAEFIEQYTAFIKRVLPIADKARREGLLSLGDILEEENVNARDIFEYGLSFVVDGVAPEIIDKVLSNIIAQEQDAFLCIYKAIQREAVMGIQCGYNSKTLYFILNSLTDIPLKGEL